jgi:hypothetical protein
LACFALRTKSNHYFEEQLILIIERFNSENWKWTEIQYEKNHLDKFTVTQIPSEPLLKRVNIPGVPGILTFIDKNIEPLIF